jgi:thiol-disulfide isomerase/thioredoxin
MKKSLRRKNVGGKRKTFRNRKVNKKGGNKNEIVVGKIYANWCGHCQNMADAWESMKKDLVEQKGGKFVFEEIEQNNENDGINKVNEKYLGKSTTKLSLQGGYPTLFKIKGGVISYFQGDRTFEEMKKWYLA